MREMMRFVMSFVSVGVIGTFGLCSQVAAGTTCPGISFGAPNYFAGGAAINALATGDLNGDGKLDVLVANEGSGAIMLRFGDGHGAFPTATQFAVGAPSSVVVADFNHDGILDFASASRLSSNSRVTVWLGTGNGNFGSPAQTTVGLLPAAMAMADFNHDGNIDLVTANGGTTTISYLQGQANGSFPTAATFSVARGGSPFGLIADDLNGDGHADIATANRGTANISVMFGNGAGAFAAAVTYPAGTQANSIAKGDFNGDGKQDLVTANLGAANLTVRFNNGLGAFPAGITLPVSNQPQSVTTGDLDGDGNVDIIATDRAGNNVAVFPGNGNGTFDARLNFPANSAPRAFAIADLDGNGFKDIAAGVDTNSFAVFLNGCSSNSAPTISAALVARQQDAGASNSAIATVDDGEDDLNDLEVTVNGGSSSTVNGVTVSNINVDSNGNVTANVGATCGALDSTFTLTVTDSGGLSATGTLGVDVINETTPPVIHKGKPIPDVTVYLPLNSPDLSMPVTFDTPAATDNCTAEPVVTTSPESGSIFALGSTVVTVTAVDDLENQSVATFRVNVLFNFGGLLPPIDPFPMQNIATAGSSVPIKFSLSGNKGMNIFSVGYPASSPVACDENDPSSTIEPAESAGNSGLQYDPLTDEYSYVWKTNKTWKRSCRILIVRLTDGSEYLAKFAFR